MNLLIIPNEAFSVTPARLLTIQEKAPSLSVVYTPKPAERQILESEIIFGRPRIDALAEAFALKWLHITSAGVEPYGDISLYGNKEIILTNSKGVYSTPVSEHAIMLLLALSRQLRRFIIKGSERIWERENEIAEIAESNVLILGAGNIGRAIALKLKPFGCRIRGIRQNFLETFPEFDEMLPPHKLYEALSWADFTVSCLPETASTVGIFDDRAFLSMKPGAVFVNVGRGSAVVESALINALNSGRLIGAGLDVTDPEPLPADSLLWNLENVIITSHSAGVSIHSDLRGYDLFMDQLDRYNSGKRLRNIVELFQIRIFADMEKSKPFK